MKHRKMIEAFNLLKEEEGAQFVVREACWKQLVKLVAPDISNSHRELLLCISDNEQKGFIARVMYAVGSSSWPFDIRPSSPWRMGPPVLSTGKGKPPLLSDSSKQCGFPHSPLEPLALLLLETGYRERWVSLLMLDRAHPDH